MVGVLPRRRADLHALPKAHLHLHFTGSMQHETLLEPAARDGIALPESLVWRPPRLSAADEKGWFRFQRLYDVARGPCCAPRTTYAAWCGRPPRTTSATAGAGWRSRWTRAGTPPGSAGSPRSPTWCWTRSAAQRDTGLGMAVVIAANRTRHPLDARTLARLAAQYVDRGVVGFGLSNDERRGRTADFAAAFAIAERAGLSLVPHGGEPLGPDSIRTVLDSLHADRLGHGIRSAEDPALLDRIVEAGIALEVCPVSNVALGVYSDLTSVPLPTLLAAGAAVALGADDPLLFGSRLAGQYATMRPPTTSPTRLAELGRMSIRASRAPETVKGELISEVDKWLATDPDRMST